MPPSARIGRGLPSHEQMRCVAMGGRAKATHLRVELSLLALQVPLSSSLDRESASVLTPRSCDRCQLPFFLLVE
jgi:hypothetical protein